VIGWQPIVEFPADFEVGQLVLLWNVDPGIGAEVGIWRGAGQWWVATSQSGGETIDISEYSHFALITPPDKVIDGTQTKAN
jgi:hypothetical protein